MVFFRDKMEYTKKKPNLVKLLRYSEMTNIAEDLEDQKLLDIGARCIDDYEADEESRSEWLEGSKEAIEAAKQVADEKSYPWSGAANIKYPLITTAAIHFNARAYPAIINGTKIVKGKVIGDDPQNIKEDRALRVGEHMSYQLSEEMDGWEEDTDRLTTVLPIVGNVFRKTYFCNVKNKNVSKLVWAENLTYNYESGFETASRKTESYQLYPQEIIERVRYGVFLPEDIGLEGEIEEETPQDFIEQHCLIDLDGDGYKEPYVVTVHLDSKKVLRIVSRFDVEEMTVKYKGEVAKVREFLKRFEQKQKQYIQAMQEYQMMAQMYFAQGFPPPMVDIQQPEPFEIKKAEVLCIEPVEYYTKYGFIPSFDGGGYDIGLGQLLHSLGETINSNLNQMIDAGSLANMQGGFISKGLKIKRGELRTGPNQWIPVDVQSGQSVRENIVPFAFKGPSVVLLNLLTFLIDAAQDISSVKDSMTGESAGANESPTTYLTRVSEGLKIFSAIYTRIHRALKSEFKKLYRLNSIYLEDEAYFNVLDTPKAIKREDYMVGDVDVIPVSDPSIATTTQKAAKANAIYQIGRDNPRYNQYEIEKKYLESMDVNDIDRILYRDEEIPQPPPPPQVFEIQAKIEKMGAETEQIRAQTAKTYNDIEAKFIELKQKFDEIDVKKMAKMIDLLSKVVTDRESKNIFEELKDEQSGLRGGQTDGGGIPDMGGIQNNEESEVPVNPGT